MPWENIRCTPVTLSLGQQVSFGCSQSRNADQCCFFRTLSIASSFGLFTSLYHGHYFWSVRDKNFIFCIHTCTLLLKPFQIAHRSMSFILKRQFWTLLPSGAFMFHKLVRFIDVAHEMVPLKRHPIVDVLLSVYTIFYMHLVWKCYISKQFEDAFDIWLTLSHVWFLCIINTVLGSVHMTTCLVPAFGRPSQPCFSGGNYKTHLTGRLHNLLQLSPDKLQSINF